MPDWDVQQIALHKPWIQALRSQSMDCPSAHPPIITCRWVHVYDKEGQEQGAKNEPGSGNEVLLSGAIPVMDLLSVSMHATINY